MEMRLRQTVEGHVQDASSILRVSDVMTVVMAHVNLANVLVSALDPDRSFNCIELFRSSHHMF